MRRPLWPAACLLLTAFCFTGCAIFCRWCPDKPPVEPSNRLWVKVHPASAAESVTNGMTATGPFPNEYKGDDLKLGRFRFRPIGDTDTYTTNSGGTIEVHNRWTKPNTVGLDGNFLAFNKWESFSVDITPSVTNVAFWYFEPNRSESGGATNYPSDFRISVLHGDAGETRSWTNLTHDKIQRELGKRLIEVHSDKPFRRLELREMTRDIEDEQFGEFYAR